MFYTNLFAKDTLLLSYIFSNQPFLFILFQPFLSKHRQTVVSMVIRVVELMIVDYFLLIVSTSTVVKAAGFLISEAVRVIKAFFC